MRKIEPREAERESRGERVRKALDEEVRKLLER